MLEQSNGLFDDFIIASSNLCDSEDIITDTILDNNGNCDNTLLTRSSNNIQLIDGVFGVIETSLQEIPVNFYRQRSQNLYPSQASCVTPKGIVGKCARAVWYSIMTEDKRPDYRGISDFWTLNIGNDIEERLVDKCKELGILVPNSSQYQVYEPELRISGRIDMAVYDGDNMVLCEIKSTNGKGFGFLLGFPGYPGRPKDDHLMQTMLYLHLLDHMNFDRAHILYVCKDDGRVTEFKVKLLETDNGTFAQVCNVYQDSYTMNPDISIEGIMDRYRLIRKYIDDNELPPRDFDLFKTDDEMNELIEKKKITKRSRAGQQWLNHGIPTRNWQCIAEGTMISKADGTWCKIEEVEEGMIINTSSGKSTVEKVMQTGTGSQVARVAPYLLIEYEATHDHMIQVSTVDSYKHTHMDSYELVLRNKRFSKVSDIDTSRINFVTYPIDMTLDKNISPMTDNEIIAVTSFVSSGYYIHNENGSCNKAGITFLTQNLHLAVRVGKAALQLGATCYDIDNTGYNLRLEINGKEFVELLQKYIGGKYPNDRYLLSNVMVQPYSIQYKLLEYLTNEDDRGAKVYTTPSKALALQLQMLFLRNNRLAGISVYSFDMSVGKFITNLYFVYSRPDVIQSRGFIYDGNLYAKLKYISASAHDRNVYDIGVAGPDHTFVTQGGVVHNCEWCPFVGTCYADDPRVTDEILAECEMTVRRERID